MDELHGRICFCKDCKQLDYAYGTCSRCGSVNIEAANHEYFWGMQTHAKLMKYVYEQHIHPITGKIS